MSPALGQLIGSVPNDAAKLAYFHGPKPVRQGLEALTQKLFPGEAFNPRTTARPSLDAYRANIHGMAEGAYQGIRDGVEDLNTRVAPDGVIDAVRGFTRHANTQPTLANRLTAGSGKQLEQDIDMYGVPEGERPSRLQAAMLKWGEIGRASCRERVL